MAVDFILPELGENIEEGDITKILVAVGDSVEVDQPLVEMETGKATVEVPSNVAGTVEKILVKEGDKARVGQVVMVLRGTEESVAPAEPSAGAPPTETTPAPPPPTPAPAAAPIAAPPAASGGGVPVAAAPSVRKFAREIGIDVTRVPGTAPHGRITIDDVKAYSKQLNEGRADGAPVAGRPAALPLPDFSLWGNIERVPMNTIRRMTVEHMERCWSTIPHVTQQDKADITELEKLRKRHGKKAEDAGGKLTPTAILLKIVGSALKVFKEFNASIDTESNEIVYKQYINVGVAVDTPNGLVVPVIRDIDRKNIIELSVELAEIAQKMRGGNISPKDIAGGNFTLSNIGGIGGSYFTPIVSHPEVGILGVGRAALEPVFVDGAFEPRLMLPLSLSYDHRLIDGATGARFLRWIGDAINEPLMLALEG